VPVPAEPLASLVPVTKAAPVERTMRRTAPLRVVVPVVQQVHRREAVRPKVEEGASDLPRWNRMAIVSGAFLLLSLLVLAAGGGYFLSYVLTFSFLTGLIGLLLCIKHKERGKGIAIAAMAFPIVLLAAVIAALLTWH
jgi:hypothetical protein